MLTVRGLCAAYERAQVLFELSFAIETGEILALLGRNGAGKSTTLKAIMGLVRVTAGSITLDGAAVVGREPHETARLGVGYVPEERRIFRGLTVAENLEVGRRAPGDGATTWTPERLFALFPNLADLRHRRGGEISGGEQQMLAIARTLMGNPRLLLLDEPSEGLAPVIVAQMRHAIADLKAEGVSVLLAEQNVAFALSVADRVAIMETGRIRYGGSASDLQHDPEARRKYLAV